MSSRKVPTLKRQEPHAQRASGQLVTFSKLEGEGVVCTAECAVWGGICEQSMEVMMSRGLEEAQLWLPRGGKGRSGLGSTSPERTCQSRARRVGGGACGGQGKKSTRWGHET